MGNRNILRLGLLFIFKPVVLVSLCHSSALAQTDTSLCFEGYASQGTSALQSQMVTCITGMSGVPVGANISALISDLSSQYPSRANDFETLSQRAQAVYYSDQYCSENASIGQLNCGRLGQLARLNPTGYYSYNCPSRMPSHTLCSEFAPGIVREINDRFQGVNNTVSNANSPGCDYNNTAKNNCNTLITQFLSQDYCAESSNTTTCIDQVKQRLTNNDCNVISGFNLRSCLGTTVTVASVDPTGTTPSPDGDSSGGGGSDGGSGSGAGGSGQGGVEQVDPTTQAQTDQNTGNNTDVTQADTNRLAGLARSLGGGFMGGGSGSGGAGGSTNVPRVNSSGSNLKAQARESGLNGPNQGSVGSLTPSNLPLSAQLPQQTAGRPGGKPQANRAQGGGPNGGGSGGMGGGGMGGGGQTGGSAAAGGKSNGRSGGYRSSYSAIAENLGGNNYLGTSPTPQGQGQAEVVARPQNKKNNAKTNQTPEDARAKINAAFQSGLRRSGQTAPMAQPRPEHYFPSVQDAYERIYRSRQVLGDSGELL